MDGRGGLTGPRGQYGGSAPGKAVWMGVGIEGGRQGGHTPSISNGSVQEPWREMWHRQDCWIGNHEDKPSQSFCRLNTVGQLWLVVKKMLH